MILKKERGFRRGAGRGGAASGEYMYRKHGLIK
jgi:hypothetical protein